MGIFKRKTIDTQKQAENLSDSAMNAFEVKKYKKAICMWKKAAALGDINARYNLGYMYEKGYGTDVNKATAFNWYLKSAEQGDADSQYKCGVSYFAGKGAVTRDMDKAISWFEKSAAQGNVDSKSVLAFFNGIETDNNDKVILNDENDNEVLFNIIDLFEYEEAEYVVLFPEFDAGTKDDAEIVIMQLVGSEGEEELVNINDNDILQSVFEFFKERLYEKFGIDK